MRCASTHDEVRTLVLLFAMLVAVPAWANEPAAPLPKRVKPVGDGRWASPMGFRDTVEWYRKELRRRGVNVRVVGPVRVRDVVYVRILPEDSGVGWSAVHILLADGRTSIYVVARFTAPVDN
jgi:hypothetical protein